MSELSTQKEFEPPKRNVKLKCETKDFQAGNRLPIPEEVRDVLDIKVDDKVDIFYHDSLDHVIIKKHKKENEKTYDPQEVYTRKPLLKRMVSVVIIFALAAAIMGTIVAAPQSAFAQADCPPDYLWDQAQQACLPPGSIPTPTTDNQTPVTSVPTTSPLPPAGSVLTTELSGRSAYFPLRIVVKYPAGLELKPSALPGSQTSVFNLNNYVNTPAPGFVTTEFSTAVADSFTVNIGQRYEFPINQVAQWEVFSNEERVQSGTIPITTDNFFVTFQFVTIPAPHIPTAEELNSGVYERIADVKAEVVKNNDVVDNLSDSMQNTSVTLQGFVGFAIMLVIVLLVGITALVWHGKISQSRLPTRDTYAVHSVMKPAVPPAPAARYSSTMVQSDPEDNKRRWWRR